MNSAVILALLCVSFPRAGPGQPQASPQELQGPEACAVCHPRHYLEWRGSMHAYSTVDPLVQACNRKALRETGGKIGGFCVSCHVPAGVRSGEIVSSLEAKDISPLARQGISCEICHKMEPPPAGKPIANASFEMASGSVVYGRLRNPAATPAHETVTGELIGKSELCGTCHDVMHDTALIEKSFAQWSGSPYRERDDRCQDCHMLRYSGQAAVGGPFRETLHRHNFPAVSVPVVAFPNHGLQEEQVAEFLRTAARVSVIAPVAAPAGGELLFTVGVKNSGAGHNLPTGLSNERQMWVEATVLDGAGRVLFQSGGLDSNGDLMDHHSVVSPGADRWLLSFSDRFLDEKGKEVPFIWLASRVGEGSLKPLEERGATYRLPLEPSLEGARLRVRVRLLFRSFPPYALRDLGIEDLARKVPIREMDTFTSAPIAVVRELPRRTEYRVPEDFPSIQEAIDALRDGDRVTVASGLHPLERPLDFRGKSIHLASSAGPEKTELRFTGDPARKEASVVLFRSGEGPGSKLEGFTISGGRGVETGGIRRGGGVHIARSSPTILRNRISGCEAAGGLGGGIYCEGGAAVLSGNEVTGCSAERGGGIAFLRGEAGAAIVEGGALEGNIAGDGGAVHVARGARTRLRRVEIAGNTARREGGGLHAEDGADWEIDHATVVFNRAGTGPGALRAGAELRPISSSIFWANEPPGGAALFRYCLLDQDPPSPTNRSAFPLFLEPSGRWEGDRWVKGDYRLLPGSPAIDAGDPAAPADPDDSRTDIGAHFLEQPLKAFVRGDVRGDGVVKPDDLALLARHWLTGEELPCLDAADVNDDGSVDPLDALSLAVFLLAGKLEPAPPSGACGLDPTPHDGLTCGRKGRPCLGNAE